MTVNCNLYDQRVQELHPMIRLSELCAAISHERLGAYSLDTDQDSTDALARYLWNGALCTAFHPSLHTLEVALRNNLFRASQNHVNMAGRTLGSFRCWINAHPTFLYTREQERVDEAIQRINPNPRFHTPGRLVAKLGFGFWTALCRSPYDHSRANGPKLWPTLLPHVFPNMPRAIRTRATVQSRMDDIREFRNRIAHHEPIWDRDLLRRYDEILDAISWMYPNMAKAVRVCGDLELTFHNGPQSFRPLAARLLGAA